MSDILSRYPVVFEDEETKQVLPHYDKASNQYYNNRNTHMASDNLQDAIDELHDKIGQSGQQTYTNCNVIKLEDCEGYENRFALDEIPTYNYSNPQTGTSYNKTQFDADEHNAELLQLAQDTSVFIQSVINTLNKGDILLFPNNKVFLIGCGEIGYLWGQRDTTITPEEFDAYPGKGTPQWYGLEIRRPVHIDLNGSTLKAAPYWYPHYIMIYIGRWRYAWEIDTDPISPAGSVFRNGTLLGAKSEISRVISLNSSWEHYKCLDVTCTITLEDLIVGDSIGDGLCVASHYDYANNPTIYFSNQGYLNVDTGKITTTTDNAFWCSGYNNINDFRYNYYNFELICRPYTGVNKSSYVDLARYYIDEKYTVSYYTAQSESSFIAGSCQKLRWGDKLTIPPAAKYFRISVDVDPDIVTQERPIPFQVIVVTIDIAYDSVVRRCNISNCGRDGITLSSAYNGLVENCIIRRCSQASIDIESLAYMDRAMVIKGLIADTVTNRTAYNGIISDSTISYVFIDGTNYILDNCDIKDLFVTAPERDFSHYNISVPRRLIKNSIIRNSIHSVYAIYENCIISGDFPIATYVNRSNGLHRNTFKNCIIKCTSILAGEYYNCEFVTRKENKGAPSDLLLNIYNDSQLEENKYDFVNCKFDINSISSFDNWLSDHTIASRVGVLLSIINCNFRITGDRGNQVDSDWLNGQGTNFGHCYIKDFVGNYIKITAQAGSNKTKFPIVFNLYNNTKIDNNIFEALGDVNAGKFIKIELNNLHYNNVHNVSIKNNTVLYFPNKVSGDSVFVFVKPINATNDITFDVSNNTFILLPISYKSVKSLPKEGSSNYLYRIEQYSPIYYYKWIAITIDNFSQDGVANVVYYSTLTEKFYTWDDTIETSDETYNKYVKIDNETGYRIVDNHIIPSITGTGVGDSRFIYHNSSTDKYYIWSNNSFVEITNKIGLKPIVLSIGASSNSVDYAVTDKTNNNYAANVKINSSVNKAKGGIINNYEDERIINYESYVDGPTVNNLLDGIAVHHVLQSIVEVSSLPSTGVSGKIYYNTSTSTYHKYENNEWSEITI